MTKKECKQLMKLYNQGKLDIETLPDSDFQEMIKYLQNKAFEINCYSVILSGISVIISLCIML